MKPVDCGGRSSPYQIASTEHTDTRNAQLTHSSG